MAKPERKQAATPRLGQKIFHPSGSDLEKTKAMRKRLALLLIVFFVALWGSLRGAEALWEPAWIPATTWIDQKPSLFSAPSSFKRTTSLSKQNKTDRFSRSMPSDPSLLFFSLPPIPNNPPLLREHLARGLSQLTGNKTETTLHPLQIQVDRLQSQGGQPKTATKALLQTLQQKKTQVFILCFNFRTLDPAPFSHPPKKHPLWKRLRAWLPLLRVDRSQALPGVSRPGFFPRTLRLFFRGGVSDEKKIWEKIGATLIQYHRLSKEAGSTFIPLYVPQAFEVDGANLTQMLEDLRLSPKHFEAGRPSRHFRDLCQRLGLPYVATLTALRRVPNKAKRPLYQTQDPKNFESRVLTNRGLRFLLRPLLPILKNLLTKK